jgi:predicted nucleic acid-binding protein
VPVVDASTMTAIYRPSEPHHAACMEFYAGALHRGEELAAPAFLLVEVAAALTRQHVARDRVESVVDELERWLVLYPVSADLLSRAREVALRCGTRGADSMYVALAGHLDDELVTVDVDQATRGGTVVQTWNLISGVRLQPTPEQTP